MIKIEFGVKWSICQEGGGERRNTAATAIAPNVFTSHDTTGMDISGYDGDG